MQSMIKTTQQLPLRYYAPASTGNFSVGFDLLGAGLGDVRKDFTGGRIDRRGLRGPVQAHAGSAIVGSHDIGRHRGRAVGHGECLSGRKRPWVDGAAGQFCHQSLALILQTKTL